MKKDGKKKKFTGFELLVLAALLLLFIWIGVRIYNIWSYDWSKVSFESISPKEWIVIALAIPVLITLAKWK